MKVVVITGGTRGLGLAIVKATHDAGYRPVAVGRSLSLELKRAIDASDGRIAYESFDLMRLEEIHSFSSALISRYGRPWGLVNNAAIGLDGVLATQHERDIASVIRLNVESPVLLTKYLVRSMMIERRGRVINIASIIASTGFSGLSVYGASKAAMLGFTRSLAREVGKAGITVNAVSPGYLQTEMTSGLDGDKLKAIQRRSPLGRLATTADVASTVVYLLSVEAGAVTGSNVTVDAGSTA